MDADAHVGKGFADDAARHGNMTLTDSDEQHHLFTEPGRIDRRNIVQFLGYHLGLPDQLLLSSRIDCDEAGSFVSQSTGEFCSQVNTWHMRVEY